MAVVYNEYFDGMPADYGNRLRASRVADKIGTETKLRETGNKSLYHNKKYIGYTQRRGIVTILFAFLLLIIIGIILSGSYEPFNPSIFDTFESYQAYQPVLPRIETVLETLSGIGNNMTITQFMEQTLIVGDWGVFESLRSVLNVISRPFVFVFALITSLFDMVTGLLNAFVI